MEGVFTYLIRGNNGKYYTGISADVFRRLQDHNSGKLKSSAVNRPYHLVYYKKHANYVEARKHEKWLKKKGHDYKSKLTIPNISPP